MIRTFFCRQCLKASPLPRTTLGAVRPGRPRYSQSTSWWAPQAPPPPRRGLYRLLANTHTGAGAAGAAGTALALSPAAFVSIGEKDRDEDDQKTGEQYMLEASRAEIESQEPAILHGSREWRKRIFYFVDTYVWEPLCTGLRFFHLLVIFVPVIATIPIVWIGTRVPDRDNERTGTLLWYGLLVNSMERAGAAFIKLGQWAASRTDIFPKEMCNIMGELHSNAPAHSMRQTKKIVRSAFGGRSFDDIFEEFQEEPLGVGAIAQVYKAKLKPDLAAEGDSDLEATRETITQSIKRNVDIIAKSSPQRVPSQYVAVKVLHPAVERIVRRDLRIMAFFASMINAIPTMEWLSFPDEVAQFGEMMRLQLDLRIEAANLTLFRRNFRDRTTAWFPFPYSDYTTKEVLIEEFAQGIPLSDFLNTGGGIYQKDIADECLDSFLRMVLLDNFIHADLHPGNIMVRFYKPSQVVSSAKLDILSRPTSQATSTPVKHGLPKANEATEDVTEEVLARLRPHKKDRREWENQLCAIEDEGYRPQLIFIDTGLVTELNHFNRGNFLDLFKAVAEFDGYRAGHLMIERCRQPEAVINGEVFALRMQHLVLGVKTRTFTLGNIKIGDVLSEVLDMVRSHHVRLEGDFVNVVLSILLLEGIGRSLDPNMDLFAAALPILRQVGTQGGSSILETGDFSMIKVWAGLEVRRFITASVEEVERAVKYDQLSPNV